MTPPIKKADCYDVQKGRICGNCAGSARHKLGHYFCLLNGVMTSRVNTCEAYQPKAEEEHGQDAVGANTDG